MKSLLFISNVRIPSERAAGIQIMKMCEAFAHEGLDVTLALPWRFARIKGDPFAFYGVERTFRIVRLPALDFMPLEWLLGKAAFWIRTVTFWLSLWVYRLFHRFDVVYSREWFLTPRGGILELHKFPASVRIAHRDAWRRARKIIVITQALKDDLVDMDISEQKILVAPDAVDIELFNIDISTREARSNVDLPQDDTIVLYAGSVLPWKGADIFLEAAQYLPETLFVVVGGRDDRLQLLRETTKDLPNVRIVGRRPYNEIPLWLKAADVLVLPNRAGTSISERYTSPLKLFEYMASGRPIVASDLSSLREIVPPDAALFVEANDAKALARGIREVLKNGEHSRSMAKRSLKVVFAHTWKKRARLILKNLVRD